MQGKTYKYFNGTPLYEFGYGLSYSTFEYSIVSIPQSITAGDTIKITAEIKNTSAIAGDEVVQLYVSLPQSALWKTPIRALQGFKRIHLAAGESRKVEFSLSPKQMTARDANNIEVITIGEMQISVGGKQPDKKAISAKQVAVHNVKVLPVQK
jgi:beta-glucosidase